MGKDRCRNRHSKQYTGDVSVRRSDTAWTHRRRSSITATALAVADCMGPCSRPMHTWIGTTSGSKGVRKTFRCTAVRRPGGTSAATADATCSQSTKRSRGSCGTCRRPSKVSPCPATRGGARSTSLSLRNRRLVELRTVCPSTTATRHQKSAPLQRGLPIDECHESCGQCRLPAEGMNGIAGGVLDAVGLDAPGFLYSVVAVLAGAYLPNVEDR